jgi:hypothetical protein
LLDPTGHAGIDGCLGEISLGVRARCLGAGLLGRQKRRVKRDSKARTATISNWTLSCTNRSGSECIQKKNTPAARIATTSVTATMPNSMSVSPGAVKNIGRW